ncbi:DUF2750 domain-containing protein [Macrococcus bovicus]|uniref:DUF2750 domain-containing protein n=1 Tax=Macrococcus bovicus TaxID=69968 RepID=A0A4R6C267_9STAP|nr:DUF2750 domain-containing protein [Macrococcus bovicus]TDM15397.1 DUF2750 domain-containing protein [Macrococcus bovicus]
MIEKMTDEVPQLSQIIDVYKGGNKPKLGKWSFYPIKDKEFMKETALDLLEINKRNDYKDYFIIAHDKEESYLGISKKDGKLYCWCDWPEVEPQLMFENISELIAVYKRLPDYSSSNEQQSYLTEKLLQYEGLYYLFNPDIEYIAGNYSIEYFPQITFLYWDSEDKAKNYRKGNWDSFEIRYVERKEFIEMHLADFLDNDDYIGFNWKMDYEIDISPENFLNDF